MTKKTTKQEAFDFISDNYIHWMPMSIEDGRMGILRVVDKELRSFKDYEARTLKECVDKALMDRNQ